MSRSSLLGGKFRSVPPFAAVHHAPVLDAGIERSQASEGITQRLSESFVFTQPSSSGLTMS